MCPSPSSGHLGSMVQLLKVWFLQKDVKQLGFTGSVGISMGNSSMIAAQNCTQLFDGLNLV